MLESSLMRPSLRKRSRAVRLDVAHGSASSVQGIMGDRPGRKPYEDGKKSVEMFLNAVLCLPHVICSPVGWDRGRDNKATEHIRRELTAAVGQRYREASRAEKTRILDELVVVTGLHRKHAMRLLRGEMRQSSVRRTRRRIYEEAERNALVVLWPDLRQEAESAAAAPDRVDGTERSHGPGA